MGEPNEVEKRSPISEQVLSPTCEELGTVGVSKAVGVGGLQEVSADHVIGHVIQTRLLETLQNPEEEKQEVRKLSAWTWRKRTPDEVSPFVLIQNDPQGALKLTFPQALQGEPSGAESNRQRSCRWPSR